MKPRIWSLATASIIALSTAVSAHAQQAAAKGGEETTLKEVVVTGTLLRGVAPSGTEVVGVDKAQIQATGATTTNQLLASVPQITTQFATLPVVGTVNGTTTQVSRPNLRNLPGAGTQSGNSTLILVDGHRIASAGVTQFAPDADVVPPSIVDRIEIVPDGGSSIYGTDAVGGVINFITKRRVEGIHVDVKGGFADHYNTINSDLTVGKAWDTGSAYLAWDYQHNTALYTRYRDYAKTIDWATGVPTGRQCDPPNLTVGGVNYAYPGLVRGSFNACDNYKTGTLYPRQVRNSVFGGVSQDFGERVKLDLRAFYTARDAESPQGPLRVSANVTPSNPFYIQIPGTPPGATQNAQFTFGPVLGDSLMDASKIKEWGVTPTVSVDLGHDWQVRNLLNFGGSHTSFFRSTTDTTALNTAVGGAGLTTQTAINPYNLALTPNYDVIRSIASFAQLGESFVNLLNFRSVADGPVFSLPGGEVRLAVGVEYLRNHLRTRNNSAGSTPATFDTSAFLSYTQDVKSVFGEVQIPIVGANNAIPGIHALSLSASGRYDKYNDFGSTANPKVGVTYEPIDWLTIRGSWGKSFNAPTPVDQLGVLTNAISAQNFFVTAPVGTTVPAGAYNITLTGSKPGLQPQKATEYSLGGDIRWPFAEGLKSSVTYYNINYEGLLGRPPFFNPVIFFPNFPNAYILNPTQAQIAAAGASVPGGSAQVAQFLQPGGPQVFEIIDFRLTNLGSAKIRGLDFSTSYTRPTSFGSIDISVNGSYALKNEQSSPGSQPADNLLTVPQLLLSATVGANVGQLRAQATLNHRASYHTGTFTTAFPQDSIGAFNVVNLFFRYDLQGEDWRKNLSFSLNVDNVFDTDPPEYRLRGNTNGFTNGSTLGRLVQFGVHKDF